MRISVKIDPIVREYVGNLTDHRLWYLHDFVFSRPPGYMEELCKLVSTNMRMNQWLQSSENVEAFWDRLDQIETAMRDEIRARDEHMRKKDSERAKVVSVAGASVPVKKA
jgi:hypothetical protein